MDNDDILYCIFCGSAMEFGLWRMEGVITSALVCSNMGCGASGPTRESEKIQHAKSLAVSAYKRYTENYAKAIKFLEQYRSQDPQIAEFLTNIDIGKSRRFRVGFNSDPYRDWDEEEEEPEGPLEPEGPPML